MVVSSSVVIHYQAGFTYAGFTYLIVGLFFIIACSFA